jgi:UDP-3-O-acyl-N-acetylglucosamine deacetylase
VITREVVVERGGARIVAGPRTGAGCLFRYELDYGPAAPIAAQSASWDSGTPDAAEVYEREVAPARTFCTEAEARAFRAAGLFGDRSPRDMLVIGEEGPIDNAYRFENEPARHKLLDLIGDLALVGRPLHGEVVAMRSGHALNHELAAALADGI